MNRIQRKKGRKIVKFKIKINFASDSLHVPPSNRKCRIYLRWSWTNFSFHPVRTCWSNRSREPPLKFAFYSLRHVFFSPLLLPSSPLFRRRRHRVPVFRTFHLVVNLVKIVVYDHLFQFTSFCANSAAIYPRRASHRPTSRL